MAEPYVPEWALMTRLNKLLLFLLLSLVGCDREIPQQVIVRLPAEVAHSAEVVLFDSLECSGEAVALSANDPGVLRFKTESTRGGVGVVTQELSLCIRANGDWTRLWSSRHGGGATLIEVSCSSLTADCEDAFSY